MMSMSRFLVFLIILFLSQNTFSQLINIEQKRLNSNEDGWKGNIDFNARFTQNVNAIWQLSNKIGIQYREKKSTHLFINDISFIRSNQKDLVNFGFAHYRYTRKIMDNEIVTWESYAQIQYNSVQKIRMRTLTGSGLRFNVIQSDSILLRGGWSFMYEYEETTIPEFSNVIRNSNYVAFDFKVGKNWNLSTILYYQPNVFDFADYRVSNETNVSHNLTEHISIVFNLNFLYDSRPPTDVPVNIFSSGIMLRYKF